MTAKDIDLSKCTQCGFEWTRGNHGSHSCSEILKARIEECESKYAIASRNAKEKLNTAILLTRKAMEDL